VCERTGELQSLGSLKVGTSIQKFTNYLKEGKRIGRKGKIHEPPLPLDHRENLQKSNPFSFPASRNL